MNWFSRLIERRILKAEAEGQLKQLEGEGQPLPDRTGDAHVDPGLAAGYRMMKEAGVVPEEFRIKWQIEEERAALKGITNPSQKRIAQRRIADLETRLGIAVDARKKFRQT